MEDDPEEIMRKLRTADPWADKEAVWRQLRTRGGRFTGIPRCQDSCRASGPRTATLSSRRSVWRATCATLDPPSSPSSLAQSPCPTSPRAAPCKSQAARVNGRRGVTRR